MAVERGNEIRGRSYVMYGWQLSFFSGKTRAYLHYKRIPFADREVNGWTLMRTVPRKTGAVVMPVVVTPEGEWLQDSTHIVDVLEMRFPQPAVMPATPCQRIAARLLEAWSDEWWVPVAMHYRWSYADNYPLFERDAGRALLPHFPRWMQNRFAENAANKMRGYLSSVGVVPDQHAVLERWTEAVLDVLEHHFKVMPYLFGYRPSIADFALMGPMYGHLSRDPWPAQHLMPSRPQLTAWVERMNQPGGEVGEFLIGDAIPQTLTPLFKCVLDEFYPMIEAIRDEAKHALGASQHSKLPRALGMIEFPMAGGRFRRAAMPYSLWMMQRVMDDYAALPPTQRVAVDAALVHGSGRGSLLMDLGLRLERSALRVRATRNSESGFCGDNGS